MTGVQTCALPIYFTFQRPSRKGWHTGAILPGTNYDETIDICVSIDMSGSIGDAQAKDFLSEIKGIMQEYKDFKIKLWCFDTKVYNEQDYDGYSMEEFDEYEPMGGGGTSFEVNWSYMKKHDINPKKFIMFTDGYPCGNDRRALRERHARRPGPDADGTAADLGARDRRMSRSWDGRTYDRIGTPQAEWGRAVVDRDRKSTRLNSSHT